MPDSRCITCSHPVHKDDPEVAFIKMAGQARYFHKDPRGCQNAEAGNRYNPELPSNLNTERKEMIQSE